MAPPLNTNTPPQLPYYIHEADLMDWTHEHYDLQERIQDRSKMTIKQ